MAKLIVRAADGTTKELPLDEHGSATIGRSPECDVPIQDAQASRRHCTVVRIQSGFEVADLGSTNGTLVNGQLVKKQKLRHGDVIKIGHVEVTFFDEASASAAAPSQNCVLVYARGEKKGQRFELTLPRTTIGRKETNTLVLPDNVASSYHCEIVRNLNGYVLRDLGSTNGTAINGETVSEAQLTHGAKIRIGSTRFVFQDPSLAEVDLEMSGVEDEETSWGMMRELDLQAVRRKSPANLVYMLLFVAILGGGFYLVKFQPGKRVEGPQSPAGNLHDAYSFETAGAAYAWDGEPPGAFDVSVTGNRKASGQSALEVRAKAETGDLFYTGAFEGKGMRYRVTGKVAAQGARAFLGIQWSGLGVSRWATGPEIQAGTFQNVDLRAAAPSWARTARLGMRVRGQGTVWLDDVALLAEGAADAAAIEINSFATSVADGKGLDILYAGAPVLANGEGVAYDATGREIPGTRGALSLSCEKADEAHVAIVVKGDGAENAASLGILFDSAGDYLARGFRAFGVREGGETYFRSEIPEEPLDEVRKLLVGPKQQAIAVVADTDEGRFSTAVVRTGTRADWSIRGAPRDGAFRFRMKCDLSGESKLATDRIAGALALHQGGKLGAFLEEGKQVLAEFPFAPPSMRKQLGDVLAETQQRFDALSREAQEALRDYESFKDQQSLARVREILRGMEREFQASAGEGARHQAYEKIAGEEKRRRQEADHAQEKVLAGPLLDQSLLIHLPDGEVCSAAVLLHFIVNDLPSSPQAAQARAELEKIRATHPHILQVLERLSKG